jgi:ArsR family transcriptional regulator
MVVNTDGCQYELHPPEEVVMTSTPEPEFACCPSVLDSPLDEEQAEDLAKAYAALADPVRLRLLSLIADAGEICSCELQGPLGKSQPTISHHTKQLSEVGLITGERRGRWVWWRIVPERVAALHDSLGSGVTATAS